jgi:ribosome hibernation promoting factor
MAVEFTGRHLPVTSTLRALAQERVKKLERHLGGPAQVRVVLSQEKHRFGAEVIATHRRRLWKAQEETGDPRAALALAFEKIDAQAMRDVEKRRDRKHRGGSAAAPLKREEGASARGPSSGVSRDWRIVRSPQRAGVKPMSVEEAALKLDNAPFEFLVFRDAANERISILYKRRDGDFGLIVPQC